MSEEMLFIFKGNILKEVEAARYSVLATGLIAENVTYVFETGEAK